MGNAPQTIPEIKASLIDKRLDVTLLLKSRSKWQKEAIFAFCLTAFATGCLGAVWGYNANTVRKMDRYDEVVNQRIQQNISGPRDSDLAQEQQSLLDDLEDMTVAREQRIRNSVPDMRRTTYALGAATLLAALAWSLLKRRDGKRNIAELALERRRMLASLKDEDVMAEAMSLLKQDHAIHLKPFTDDVENWAKAVAACQRAIPLLERLTERVSGDTRVSTEARLAQAKVRLGNAERLHAQAIARLAAKQSAMEATYDVQRDFIELGLIGDIEVMAAPELNAGMPRTRIAEDLEPLTIDAITRASAASADPTSVIEEMMEAAQETGLLNQTC